MMTEEELAAVVRKSLHDLYPAPDVAAPTFVTPRQQPGGVRRYGVVLGGAFATVAIVAVTAVVVGQVPRSHPVVSTGTPPGSVASVTASSPAAVAAAPAWSLPCFADGVRAEQYIDLPLADAQALAKAKGVTLVVVGEDGSCLARLAKAYIRPLLVATEKGRVVEARYQGWSGPPN